MSDLAELEERVTAKYVTACAARLPADAFDSSSWHTLISPWQDVPNPMPSGTLQFPREQWASYPNKRTMALLVADRMLDLVDEMSEEHWLLLHTLMQYGGKTRLS